jgi:hypothetical protein
METVTNEDLQKLCETLWSWQACQQCATSTPCTTAGCPFHRMKRLTRFFDFYKTLTRSYALDTEPSEIPALTNHRDLFELIQILKLEPETTRQLIATKIFDVRGGEEKIPKYEQEKAIDLAVRVCAMVTSVADSHSVTLLESGQYRIPWRQDVPFSHFIADVFPTNDHPDLNDANSSLSLNIRKALRGRKLKKNARLSFHATDNIRHHLKLDCKTGKVMIFHHTAFLKEHLRLTKESPNLSVSHSLKHGVLPRQLALEILDSIQDLLFPLTDPKSRKMLQSLTSARDGSFDPDCLRFDSSLIRRADEKFVPYYYLGERLMELHAEGEDPRPRGKIWRWLERRSRPRFVMLATLAGVIIAILLGLFGLAVQIYQTWITYQAWKHPV